MKSVKKLTVTNLDNTASTLNENTGIYPDTADEPELEPDDSLFAISEYRRRVNSAVSMLQIIIQHMEGMAAGDDPGAAVDALEGVCDLLSDMDYVSGSI